jgi:fatty-acyl-CoA synthase
MTKRPDTIPQLADRAAAEAPDDVGFIWDERVITYRKIAEQSRRIAQGLLNAGVSEGDHVAMWLPNTPLFMPIFLACARIGAPVMLVNTRLSGREVGDVLRRSDSRALVVWQDHPGSAFRKTLEQIEPGDLEGVRLFIELGDAAASAHKTVSIGDLLSCDLLPPRAVSPDQAALLYSTSGSTGPSKLVVHTQGEVAAHSQDIVARFGYDAPDSVHLLMLPLAGAYGMTQALAAITSCKPGVLMEKFETGPVYDAIRRYKVTGFCVFDEIIIKLLEHSDDERPFPSLKFCGFGIFNPGYPDFAGKCERRGIRLLGIYGSSETQAFFVTQKIDASFEDRIRDGGFPVSDEGHVRIRNIETGELAPAGESGEIEVSGPSCTRRYYKNPQATSAQMLSDGFYRTGDSGRILADGSVLYEGRIDDVLRLSGYMVPTAEIETVMLKCAGVRDAKVVGLVTEAGTRPVAFLQADAGLSVETLRAACAANLARFKAPIAYHFVDEFPLVMSLNAPKTDKKRLKAMAEELYKASTANVR